MSEEVFKITGRGTVGKGVDEKKDRDNRIWHDSIKFEIVRDKQTPKVPVIKNVKAFIEKNRYMIDVFKFYCENMTYMNPIGLAANQTSYDGKTFMMRMFGKKNMRTNEWIIIINPVITNRSGMIRKKKEGCLTWGVNNVVIADRHHMVTVDYYDIEGVKHTVTVKGFEAQVWQHEINHLDGIEEEIQSSGHSLPSVKSPERNAECPCGSGKKYKRCCIEN